MEDHRARACRPPQGVGNWSGSEGRQGMRRVAAPPPALEPETREAEKRSWGLGEGAEGAESGPGGVAGDELPQGVESKGKYMHNSLGEEGMGGGFGDRKGLFIGRKGFREEMRGGLWEEGARMSGEAMWHPPSCRGAGGWVGFREEARRGLWEGEA